MSNDLAGREATANAREGATDTGAADAIAALRAITLELAHTSGGEFYRTLALECGRVFGACDVTISERSSDGTRMIVLGSWTRSGLPAASERPLAETAAELVMRAGVIHHTIGARAEHPDDDRLARLYAESYLGLPIVDGRADVVGVIELTSDVAGMEMEPAATIVAGFASRVVAELERSQAEAALRDSELRYRTLIEDSFHLVAEIVDERFVFTSAGYGDALGYAPEDVLGGSLYDLIHPEDRRSVAADLQAMVAQRRSAQFTVRMRHQDGSWRWIESTARAFRASTGEFRTTLFSRDVTAQQETEQDLREKERRFRTLVNDLQVGVLLHGPNGEILHANGTCLELLGLSEEQMLGSTPHDVPWELVRDDGSSLPLDEQPEVIVLRTGKSVRDAVVGIKRRESEHTLWLLVSAEPRMGPDNERQVVVTFTDISLRLAAEERLRESEERFRLLAENASDVILRYGANGACTWVSPSVQTVTGYTPEEFVALRPEQTVLPADLERGAAIRARVAAGEDGTIEFRFRHKYGHTIWLEATSKAVCDLETGAITEVHMSGRDITARRQAIDSLRESEERFRLLAENASDVIARFEPSGVCTWISPSIEAVSGFAPEEIIGKQPREFIHPDDVAEGLEARQRTLESMESVTSLYRFPRKGGGYLWMESANKAIRAADGSVIEIQVSARDVTARKQAEDDMRKSEELFRLLAEHSTDLIGRYSFDGTCLWISPSSLAITGYTPEELIGKDASRHFHPDDLPDALATMAQMAGGLMNTTSSFRFRHKDGHYIWLEAKSRSICDEHGAIVEVQSTTRDVTTRIEREEEVQESESRFRLLAENATDIIARYDAEGTCLWISPSVTAVTGFLPEEIIGLQLPQLVHRKDAAVLEDASKLLTDGTETFSTTFRVPHKDGRRIWLEATNRMVRDPETGHVIEIQTASRDVTARKEAEEAMRRSEELFRATLESAADAILVTKPGDEVLYLNSRAIELLNIPPEIVEARSSPSLVRHILSSLAEPEAFAAALRSVQDEGLAHLGVLKTRDGMALEVFVDPVLDVDGGALRVWTVRDITAKLEAEDALRESEMRLRSVVNSAPLALLAVNPERRFILAEGEALRTIGIRSEQLVGSSLDEVYRNLPDILQLFERALGGEQLTSLAMVDDVAFETHFEPNVDDGGRNTGTICIAYDVSSRVRAEEALRESEETARALLNAPTDGAVLVDREGMILAMNATAEHRFSEHAAIQGLADRNFIGACVFDLFAPDLRDQRRARNDEVFATGQRSHFEDERDGTWTDVTIDPIYDADGKVVRLAIFSRDITDRKRDEAALKKRSRELEALNDYLEKTHTELERSQDELRDASEQLAQLLDAEQARAKTDPLTGVLNHGAISEVITEAIEAEIKFGVAMVDVDGMKAVNDTYGHQAGDDVLLAVTKAIGRGGAIVGRYGGDEFLVALLNADGEEAAAYKKAVDEALAEAHVVDPESGARVAVVASVGIASYPADAPTLPELIERADERMYAEKRARQGVGTGLSSSRILGSERAARMVGELVPLLTSEEPLADKLRLVAHRVTVGGGYAGVNFDVFVEEDGDVATTSSQNAFTKAPDELIDEWNRQQRAGTNQTGVGDLLRETKRPLIIDSIADSEYVTDDQRKILSSVGILSAIVVPLFSDDAMVATMSVGSKEPSAFGHNDEQFLTAVAGQVAAIIRMARLVEHLQSATDRLESSRGAAAA